MTLRTRLSAATYAITNAFARAVLFTFARWTIVGRDRIPKNGPLIFVANHVHLLDPPLVGASATRRVHPMAKRELFETPLIGWYFWAYGAFPVRRFSGDTGALRVARNYLRNNSVVLMFPEGTRSKTGAMRPALPGAGMVALLAGAPIVPVGITGSDVKVSGVFLRALRSDRQRITVTFGDPFTVDDVLPRDETTGRRPSEARAAELMTDRMMRAVAALLPPEMQGEYGPQTAGTVVIARPTRRPDGTSIDAGAEGDPDADATAE